MQLPVIVTPNLIQVHDQFTFSETSHWEFISYQQKI